MNFNAIRKEYEDSGLDRDQLLDDPIQQLEIWLNLAIEKCPGSWFEPNAMTLSTADRAGNLSARIVLLKGIQAEGISFYTNYDSRKGGDMADDARVAVVFHWPYLGRQLRMTGRVEKTSRENSESYFHSRPRGSQLSAYVSRQSSVVDSRDSLKLLVEQAEQEFAEQPVPLPDDWGGYLLMPSEFEFWQGRRDRLHDRFRFQKSESGWKIERLAP